MKLAVHQPQYLPWIGYLHKIDLVDVFVFQDDVQYKHREYQNGNRIKATSGPLKLSVPVITHGRRGQLLRDVQIDNTQRWRQKHLRSIVHNYGKAPFFEHYAPFFHDLYSRQWQRLIDINLYIIQFILKDLEISTPIWMESEMGIGDVVAEDRIITVCRQVGADIYYSGAGGKHWMDHSKFEAAGIKLEFQEFHHPVYRQLHGDFVPSLSVIDLILNTGPASIDYVRGIQGRDRQVPAKESATS